jgi:hypothetical protein
VSAFEPRSWLARSGHLQSIVASLPIATPPRGFVPESTEEARVPLPDGDGLLARAWWQPGGQAADVALVVHGLAGSSESRYAIRAAVALHRAGLHVVRLNLRGAGDGAPFAASFYHAGLTQDVTATAQWLGRRAETRRLHVVGFSLGGSVCLLAASEWRSDPPSRVASVSAISPPLDLAMASRWNERPGAVFYRRHLLAALREMVLGQAKRHPGRVRVDERAARRARTVWQFDHDVVAPFHGFLSAADYYERASPGPRLGRIEIPALVVFADDDPFLPPSSMTAWLARAPNVRAVRSAQGGHVTFARALGKDDLVDTFAIERVIDLVRTI